MRIIGSYIKTDRPGRVGTPIHDRFGTQASWNSAKEVNRFTGHSDVLHGESRTSLDGVWAVDGSKMKGRVAQRHPRPGADLPDGLGSLAGVCPKSGIVTL